MCWDAQTRKWVTGRVMEGEADLGETGHWAGSGTGGLACSLLRDYSGRSWCDGWGSGLWQERCKGKFQSGMPKIRLGTGLL